MQEDAGKRESFAQNISFFSCHGCCAMILVSVGKVGELLGRKEYSGSPFYALSIAYANIPDRAMAHCPKATIACIHFASMMLEIISNN